MSRTAAERDRDNQLVERGLCGELLPQHDRRIHTKVVGVKSRNDDGSSRQELIENVALFESVELERDAGDDYDPNAIRVMHWQRGGRVQLGHIDGALAAELAPAIDAGEQWGAIVTRVGGFPSKGVSLLLFRAVPPATQA